MKLYCANNHVRKTRGFRPEPDELSCETCGLRMGSFKPRTEPSLKPSRKRRPKRSGFTPASPAQRKRVEDLTCVVCGLDGYGAAIDPAHVIPRSLGGCDHELCVVPLCREHHRAYDLGQLDLLPYLEGPHWRSTLAHAVEHVGLVTALERVTNTRWSERRESGMKLWTIWVQAGDESTWMEAAWDDESTAQNQEGS